MIECLVELNLKAAEQYCRVFKLTQYLEQTYVWSEGDGRDGREEEWWGHAWKKKIFKQK